jgi:protein-S-isoprenylcysteine O-methyltransferase Ste14
MATMKLLRAIGYGFSTLAIYLGVTLLGWGLRHLGEFYSSAPRLVYAVIVGLFGLAIGIQAYFSTAGIQDAPGQKEKTVSRQTIIGGLLVGALFVSMFLLPFTSRREIATFPEFPVLAWISIPFAGLGYLLIVWSGLSLGKQYSAEVTIQEDHQLITSGPYHLIRHPRYMGILCLAVALPLLFHSWIGAALLPVVIGLVLSRVYDEETLLKQEFGQRWQEYCCHSWRLVPYIF